MAAVEKAAVAVAAVASESAASAVTEADTTAAAEATTETVEKSEKAEQRSHACFVLGEMSRRWPLQEIPRLQEVGTRCLGSGSEGQSSNSGGGGGSGDRYERRGYDEGRRGEG